MHLASEVRLLIVEHHKLLPYKGPYASSVESYRSADLVDVSLGMVRFGMTRSYVKSVKKAFPNRGFHWRLVTLTVRQFLRSPFRPLPMIHW